MTLLSICQSVLSTVAAPTRQALSDMIWGQQVPLYVADSDMSVKHAWQDVGVEDLLTLLGPHKYVRLMVSPTGVFGSYDGDFNVDMREQGIFIKPTDEALPAVQVPHVRFESEVGVMMSQWANKTVADFFLTPDEKYYFRSIGGVHTLPRIAQSLPPSIPRDRRTLAEVNLYISQAGTVTNLHYDPVSGVVHQLRGRKRILLFAPTQTAHFDMYPADHLLSRRSRWQGKLTQADVDNNPTLASAQGFEYIVEPGQWLYMPKGWLHYIETLDDDTISLIVTFRA